jgi:hypothetical protein
MVSTVNSQDPVIQQIAIRQQALLDDQVRCMQHLVAYTNQIQPDVKQPEISPLEHYSMLDQEGCGCQTCIDWARRREEFVTVKALVPAGHRWTICDCPMCRFVGRFQLNLLAVANRRELLIEMSFHAYYHSRHGDLVMAWLAQEMAKPSYTINWCAQEMSRYPMERWMKRCETAVSGTISGAVFTNSTMVTDMVVNLGSSLMAEVGM